MTGTRPLDSSLAAQLYSGGLWMISFFKDAGMDDINATKPLLIINATDLRTGSVFYFSAKESGSWRLGKLARTNIALAYAVAASSAYPLLFPAIDERLPFNRRDGSRRIERVTLTDGGVYDNLGLAPLWPERDPSISLNVTLKLPHFCGQFTAFESSHI